MSDFKKIDEFLWKNRFAGGNFEFVKFLPTCPEEQRKQELQESMDADTVQH